MPREFPRLPKIGDKVWAQWGPNGWYHGMVSRACDVGLHVEFDDGDEADLAVALIAADQAPRKGEVKIGSRVLALWSDAHFYPGTVTGSYPRGDYEIQFDDGNTGVAGRKELRLLAVQNAAGTPEIGDKVWAQWKPNVWCRGAAVKPCGVGLQVAFDVKADLPVSLIVVDRAPKKGDVKAGCRVLAPWRDGNFYPGTVTGTNVQGDYKIQFDDGDTGAAGLKDLRLLNQ